MSVKIINKPEIGTLVSPQGNQSVPIHNWFSFKHGYSKELATYLIKNFSLSEGTWVLDPFCGSGTTLLACKQLGINALGFDILPFSVFLGKVKISNYNEDDLFKQLEVLKEGVVINQSNKKILPDIPIVKKAFKPEIEKTLLALKSRIDCISPPQIRDFFILAFLSILEMVSNTSKDGGFLRIIDREISSDKVEGLFYAKAESMLKDVIKSNEFIRNGNISIKAKVGDARKLPTQRQYDAVITSPPYPNRHDYTRIYSLEMIFDFVSTNAELKKIRYETIRSHVEARKKYDATNYRQPDILYRLIAEVEKNGTNNSQVVGMLEGYFEDMHLSLAEMHRCLRDKGKVALVVSNVRFAGVTIPVDTILAEIGEQVGLTPKEIWAIRYRGNSSQQMRHYKRDPSRESIVIWEKSG